MIDENTREDAALFALDLLEGQEYEAFARKLAGDPELAEYVDELRASATQLVKALPQHEPPGRLRVNLLRAVQAEAGGRVDIPEPVDSPVSPIDLIPHSDESTVIPMPRSGGFNRFVPWALAACLGVTAFVSFTTNKRLLNDVASLRDERVRASQETLQRERVVEELRQSLASASQEKERLVQQIAASSQALADRENIVEELRQSLVKANQEVDLLNLRVATLTSTSNPQSLASVVWDSQQKKGVIHVERLAATTGAAVYQLWAISSKEGSVPVSAGTFTVSEDGATTYHFQPSMEVNDLSTFAVSLEAQAGLTAPQGPIVLSGKM